MEILAPPKSREFMAWAVILVSFASLCIAIAVVILGVRWYTATATARLDGSLKIVRGTVLVQESRRLEWVAASDGMGLGEGYRVRTDDASQALLTLLDGTQINLFPGSELSVEQLRRLRFSPKSLSMVLSYRRGKVRAEIGDDGAYKRDFKLSLPTADATVQLQGGSYSLDSAGETVDMKLRDGARASVKAGGREVEVRTGQRITVVRGQAPSAPVAAAREMAVNGRFQDGLSRWASGNRDVPRNSPAGKVEVVQTELGNAVKLSRTDSNATHAETFLRQEINLDVADFRMLRLFLQLKVNNQSLSGGGYMGSEYPLMVKVQYRSEKGDNWLVYGFYYQNETDNLTTNGTMLPQGEWVTYSVPQNLMAAEPAPLRILAIEITASGHDYESLVKEVSLEGE